jgi:Tfp pilus assembly protein PilN
MLRLYAEHRSKQIVAVYVEEQRVEVLRAHRQWRSWQIDSTEGFDVPEGEPIFEYLQHLNLRPRGAKTALVLFLPLTFYSFHREHYPSGLQDQLQEAVNFDWQENIFLEHERTLHFSGPAVLLNYQLSVPIFSLQRDIYDKFYQVLGAANFQKFRIIPSALAYKAFSSSNPAPTDAPKLEIYARLIDNRQLELHRLYDGELLDSMLVGRARDNHQVFLEHLRWSSEDADEQLLPIRLICTDGEALKVEAYKRLCCDIDEITVEVEPLEDLLVSHWVKYFLQQDQIQTFDAQLLLKPWTVPRIAWPLLALVGLYSLFAFYQLHTHSKLQEASRRLKREIAQLETQWKPIEQLQTRIAKFQEDQKTLSEFNLEGYPMFEIMTLLSQTTPDDTWLNYFSIRKGQIILRGDSKSAIKYLSELSKIEGFGDVRFASPVTRSPSGDDERFNVQFQVDLEKFRKTIEALELNKREENISESAPDQNSTAPKLMKSGTPPESEEGEGEDNGESEGEGAENDPEVTD